MPTSSAPLGFKPDLPSELTALRLQGDYNAAFARIDRELSAVFVDHSLPERPADLLMMVVLAGRKASLLREISGGEMVDAEGNHAGWAVGEDQREEVVQQVLGWYQLALASSGRLIGTAGSLEVGLSREILIPELSALRQDFLGWENQPGPGGQALPPLPVQLPQILFSQLWSIGYFSGAEDLLFLVRDLLADDGADPAGHGTRDVARQFYAQLQGLSDAQLEAGGLPRSELAAALAEFGIEG